MLYEGYIESKDARASDKWANDGGDSLDSIFDDSDDEKPTSKPFYPQI